MREIDLPHNERGNQPNTGMLGLIGGVLTLLASGIGLYGVTKTYENDERQREHERNMVRLAATNPNITVHTGRVHFQHYHHGDGYNPNDRGRIERSAVRSINSSRD